MRMSFKISFDTIKRSKAGVCETEAHQITKLTELLKGRWQEGGSDRGGPRSDDHRELATRLGAQWRNEQLVQVFPNADPWQLCPCRREIYRPAELFEALLHHLVGKAMRLVARQGAKRAELYSA
jgi:hypothetical protein